MNILAHQFVENLRGLSFVEKNVGLVLAGHATYNPDRPGDAVVFISMLHLARAVGIKNRETASRIVKRLVQKHGILEPVGSVTYHNAGSPPRKITKYRFTFKVLPGCAVTLGDKIAPVSPKAQQVTGAASRDPNPPPVTLLSHTESPLPVTLEVTGGSISRDSIESHNGFLPLSASSAFAGERPQRSALVGFPVSDDVGAQTTNDEEAQSNISASATTNHHVVGAAGKNVRAAEDFSSASAVGLPSATTQASGIPSRISETEISSAQEGEGNTNCVRSVEQVVARFRQSFDEVHAVAGLNGADQRDWLDANGFSADAGLDSLHEAKFRSSQQQRNELVDWCRAHGLEPTLELWKTFLVTEDHYVDTSEEIPRSWLLKDFLEWVPYYEPVSDKVPPFQKAKLQPRSLAQPQSSRADVPAAATPQSPEQQAQRQQRLYIVAERHGDHVVMEPWLLGSSPRTTVHLKGNETPDQLAKLVIGSQWERKDGHFSPAQQQIPLPLQQCDRVSDLVAAQEKRDEAQHGVRDASQASAQQEPAVAADGV